MAIAASHDTLSLTEIEMEEEGESTAAWAVEEDSSQMRTGGKLTANQKRDMKKIRSLAVKGKSKGPVEVNVLAELCTMGLDFIRRL
eukprot:3447506-Rhodomonas_salina.2